MTIQHTDPENWVANYGDYLYAIAFLKVNDREIAKDLVGETFLSALQALSGFRADSSEKTWLATILKNKIIDHYRKKKPQFTELTDYLSQTDQAFYTAFFEPSAISEHHWRKEASPSDDSLFTEYVIRNEEFNSIMQLCLEKIPNKMKLVFIARFIDDENSEDICKELDVSPSNYWILIHRAKLVMRDCLDKKWIRG